MSDRSQFNALAQGARSSQFAPRRQSLVGGSAATANVGFLSIANFACRRITTKFNWTHNMLDVPSLPVFATCHTAAIPLQMVTQHFIMCRLSASRSCTTIDNIRYDACFGAVVWAFAGRGRDKPPYEIITTTNKFLVCKINICLLGCGTARERPMSMDCLFQFVEI